MLHTTEFYVISLMIAAAIVALLGRRREPGAARQYLLAGVLERLDEEPAPQPSIEFYCCDDGSVVLRRRGLAGIDTACAVSLAVEVKGFDITIHERHAPSHRPGEPVDTASFLLDFLAPEHYFIRYVTPLTPAESEKVATLTLHNRPGLRTSRPLI